MFERGDIIRCVEGNGPWLSLNRLYAVMRGGSDPYVINDYGIEANYRSDRFQMVEPVSRLHSDDRLSVQHMGGK